MSERSDLDPVKILGSKTIEQLHERGFSEIVIVNPWQRLGSETYCASFDTQRDGSTLRAMAKACIKLSPVETVQDWMLRRSRLTTFGVSVPEHYLTDGAMIIEEYIPYTYSEAYGIGDPASQVALSGAYSMMQERVRGAGFNPASLHDARSRGQDVVLVDFGEDLGHFSQ